MTPMSPFLLSSKRKEVGCHSDQNILQKMMVNKTSKELSVSETACDNCLRDCTVVRLVTSNLNMAWEC